VQLAQRVARLLGRITRAAGLFKTQVTYSWTLEQLEHRCPPLT
jgi:hypothetical protein